jgi:ferredoxin
MTVGHGIFILIVILALSFFSYNAQRLLRYMMSVGQPEVRTDDPLTRIRNLFLIGFGQKKILRDLVAGPLHAAVFWGFVVLTIGTVEIILEGLFPGFSYALILPHPIYLLYTLSQELFAVFVLVAAGVLLYRRIVVKPKRLQGDRVHSGDAILILSMIAALMVSLITLGGFGFALNPASGTIFQPVSLAASHVFAGLSAGTLEAGRETSWWFHALLILVFLNYLPYSKHLHVITSLPNTYLANTSGPGVKGAMSYMDLEAEGAEQFGASDVTHLGWHSLLDSYSCTECGRCTAACPANLTGKLLSPRKIMINTRQRLMELAPLATGDFGEFEHPHLSAGEGGDAGDSTVAAALQNTLLDNYITEEELWACTSCRACVVECPVSIDQLDIINELRRDLVLMESRFSAGNSAGIRIDGEERLSVGVRSRRSRQMGRRDGHPDDGGNGGAWRATRGSVLGRLHGLVRRPCEKNCCCVREGVAGGAREVRDTRSGGEMQRRPRPPHGQRVSVPDAGSRQHRDA